MSFGQWQRFNPHNLIKKKNIKNGGVEEEFYHDYQTFASTLRQIHILPKEVAVPKDLHIVILEVKLTASYNLHIQFGLSQSEYLIGINI